MRRISKRLDALERAADKEAFAHALPFAIAYYLGGERDPLEFVHGYARALGYKDEDELARGTLDLLLGRLVEGMDESAADEARVQRARCELLAKFGYDPRRISPAAVPDVCYRIAMTLPEKWRAMIKSLHRQRCEGQAELKPLLQRLDGVAE